MRRMSLAQAKAQISELVDQAEHHGKPTMILRHGKPAAALVPLDIALPPAPPKRMLKSVAIRSVQKFVEEFSAVQPETSAVADLLAGRR